MGVSSPPATLLGRGDVGGGARAIVESALHHTRTERVLMRLRRLAASGFRCKCCPAVGPDGGASSPARIGPGRLSGNGSPKEILNLIQEEDERNSTVSTG